MTTKEIFFRKMFDKGDNASVLYQNYDFSKFSEEEKAFIKKLTFISKYKYFIRNFLTNNKRANNYKRKYIDLNVGNLTYDEFIEVERSFESLRNLKDSLFNHWAMLNLILFFVNVYRRPTGFPIKKDILSTGLFTFSIFLLYYLHYRYTVYLPVLNKIYLGVSNRLNYKDSNFNFNLDDNSSKNYFINITDKSI